jgi:hypothetical protein
MLTTEMEGCLTLAFRGIRLAPEQKDQTTIGSTKPRAGGQLSQIVAAARWKAARKFRAVLS